MKIRNLTKLALSGVALAAVAATLGTSTFAWYVSNTKVEVKGMTGTVAGTAIGKNLLIASNKTVTVSDTKYDNPGAYGTSLTLTSTATEMSPQTKATASVAAIASTETSASVAAIAKGDWVDKEGKAVTGTCITYKYWLKSNDAATISVALNVSNTTASSDVVKQVAYNPNGLPTNINQNDQFAANAVFAMAMQVDIQGYSIASTSVATASGDLVSTEGAVDKLATSASAATATFAADAGDANQYYYNVLSKVGYGCDATAGTSPDAAGSKWETVTLAANVDTLVTMSFWLEGTDAGCWDSCVNQSFAVGLSFQA